MPLPASTVNARLIAVLLTGILAAAAMGPAQAQERLPMQALALETLEAFNEPGTNWQLAGQVRSDRRKRHDLTAEPGQGVLVNLPTSRSRENLFTIWTHGDIELELQFMMPQGSNSGIYLQGRYEIQLLDSWGETHVTIGDVGGVYQRWDEEAGRGFEGCPPRLNASRAPGLWQTLRIVFEAPQFDASGQKARHARFVRVELNGSIVQENVTVTGPTRAAAFNNEAPTGPLMIQGDHGPVAFRHIRYKTYSSEAITVSGLEFREYEERFEAWPEDLARMTPVAAGQAADFSGHAVRPASPAAIAYNGRLHVPASGLHRFSVTLDWITGDPHFSGQRIGGARLHINGNLVLEHDQNHPYLHADVELDAGAHPFTFVVFKSTGGRKPNFGLSVEGPGTPVRWLRELEIQSPTPPILMDTATEPVILRGFVRHRSAKRTHAVSVGDPSGVHYSYDLAIGAMLHAWRGPFVDLTQMWHNRGHNQLAIPRGSTLTLSGSTFLVAGDNPAEGLTFTGYRIDTGGRPQFLYRFGDLRITDRIRPDEGGQHLTRTLTFEGQTDHLLRVQAAANSLIESMDAGSYAVGDRSWYIEKAGNAALQSGPVLLLPVQLENGRAEVSYEIVW